MSSTFKAASEAAENWLSTANTIAYLAGRLPRPTPDGDRTIINSAFMLLMPTPNRSGGYNLLESYGQHADTLTASLDQLAALSDGPIEWAGDLWEPFPRVEGAPDIGDGGFSPGPHYWSSAHEAAVRIARMALQMLVWPLEGITDPAEQTAAARRLLLERGSALRVVQSKAWRERIHRERAKLLSTSSPEPEPLLVTLRDIEWLSAFHVSIKTMSQKPHIDSRPKKAGTRNRALVFRYREILAWWKWEPLPPEEEARRLLASRPKESS